MIEQNQGDLFDCVIVGGGPAGITAGIYLARYRRNIILFDAQCSRTLRIPRSHNYPGFAQGIPGPALLKRLRQHLHQYNIPMIMETVDTLKCIGEEFFLGTKTHSVSARNVILATGVIDVEPALPNLLDGIYRGLIRHCPICDGFEIINKKVGVIGEGKSGLKEALFLRNYTPHLTLMTLGKKVVWKKSELEQLKEAQITLITDQVMRIKLTSKAAKMHFSQHGEIMFDCLYSALGCIKNNKLALEVGCKEIKGFLKVDKNFQTSIKGLYAAGDIVSGLSQICVAESQAAVAATEIHNQLLLTQGF